MSAYGFEALRLSIWGARSIFGPRADYAVSTNTIPLEEAKRRTGPLPRGVSWYDASRALAGFLGKRLDRTMAEGVGWKFAPPRLFPHRHELALDNDCILWSLPSALLEWFAGDGERRCVIAEDVWRGFGRFEALCGPEPLNSGIRGLPPGFDLESTLMEILQEIPCILSSELDEQGLSVAAASRHSRPLVVSAGEVSICSPFPPHVQALGRCGAHFVGLNAKSLPWECDGRPGVDHIREHWLQWRGEVRCRITGASRRRAASERRP